MDDPTPYPELNGVLQRLAADVQHALGPTFVGAYLQGSFAVGDFDEHSDADFVIAVRTELSDEDVAALQAVHGRVFDLPGHWAKHLEGSYFPLHTLRSAARVGTPLWYLDHGSRSLVRSNHCNTVLVRSVLRDSGLVLAGPAASGLIDPISPEALRGEIADTVRNWGNEILEQPDAWRNRFYQGYLVLNYARMLHDLREGRPGSKRAGAEWAKATLDPEWHDLIDRAWTTRPDPATSVREPPNADDFARTLQFVRLCIDLIPHSEDRS